MCEEEEENKGGNEESWETIFRSPKPRDLTLARPICGVAQGPAADLTGVALLAVDPASPHLRGCTHALSTQRGYLTPSLQTGLVPQ